MLMTTILAADKQSINLRRLEVKNRAGEPVYIQLQGLGYDYADEEYTQWPSWGQFYYLTVNPPGYVAQDGTNVWLDQEAIQLFTILQDRYYITVFYEQEIAWKSDPDAKPYTCFANFVVDNTKFNGLEAYWDMNHNARLVVNDCIKKPANRGDLESGIYKWYRPWFMSEKK